MAEIEHHEGAQVLLTTVRVHLSYLYTLYVETKDMTNRSELFWQDLEKKIEETRQRFKNEFLQGNSYFG